MAQYLPFFKRGTVLAAILMLLHAAAFAEIYVDMSGVHLSSMFRIDISEIKFQRIGMRMLTNPDGIGYTSWWKPDRNTSAVILRRHENASDVTMLFIKVPEGEAKGYACIPNGGMFYDNCFYLMTTEPDVADIVFYISGGQCYSIHHKDVVRRLIPLTKAAGLLRYVWSMPDLIETEKD